MHRLPPVAPERFYNQRERDLPGIHPPQQIALMSRMNSVHVHDDVTNRWKHVCCMNVFIICLNYVVFNCEMRPFDDCSTLVHESRLLPLPCLRCVVPCE